MIACSFRQRLAGIRRLPPGHGLLLWGRSVHGHRLQRPLWVISIASDGLVREVRVLRPGGLVTVARAGWLLEVPAGGPLPPPGAVLEVRPPNLPG